MTIEEDAKEYFILFSKLEYALKNSGYATSKKEKFYAANCNWAKFIENIKGKIKIDVTDTNIDFFLKNRPQRQIYKDGKLDFTKNDTSIQPDEIEKIIESCKIIRNNLFHGGKNENDEGSPGRNTQLIKAATKILNAAIAACPIVKEKFVQATLKG